MLACARNKEAAADVGLVALESVFSKIATRYDLVLLDLPVTWFGWTRQILSVSDLVFVCGFNTIPGLRQVGETLQAMRSTGEVRAQGAVILNRCEHRLLRGVLRRQHARNVLGNEEIFYVRENAEPAVHAVNTGIPLSSSDQSNKIRKDIGSISKRVAALEPARPERKP